MRVAPSSPHRELPPLPLARTHRRTERVYQEGSPACNPPRFLSGAPALCYTARHAAHEKVHQESQQGEEAGAEAQAPPPQQGPSPRDAREITLSEWSSASRSAAAA